jgi:MFS family permease
VLLLYVLASLGTASHGATEFVFPLNLARLGHPLWLIGPSVALVGLGALLSRLPGGAWYRLGRARLLIVIAGALMALSSMALAASDAWPTQALLGTLHGLSFGLASTFQMALLIQSRAGGVPMATTMAWYTAGISLGYALSGPLGAEGIERWGHQMAFVASGAVGLFGALLALGLRSRREVEPERAGGRARPATGLRAIRALPVGVWLGTLLVFYINFLSDVYNAFFPIYATALGIALTTIGALKMAHSLAATGIRFLAAGIFRLVPFGAVNQSMVVAMSLGMLALSLWTDEALLFVAFAVLGTSRGLLRITSATMVAEEREGHEERAGVASAIYNGGLDLGSMLGPPIAGALASLLDIPTSFRLMGLGLPAVYFALWLTARARSRDEAARRASMI